MRFIDNFLDRTTMYRLLVYYLAGLLGVAFLLSFAHLVPVEPTALAFSSVVILLTCGGANQVFAAVFRVIPNRESVHITALILILLMPPVTADNPVGLGALVFVAVWAIASKFILTFRGAHVFNPAAFGVALGAILLDQPATWWIAGNTILLPLVLVGGLAVIRKLRRLDLAVATIGMNLLLVILSHSGDIAGGLWQDIGYSPLLFFTFVMVTEPLTAPRSQWGRIVFGLIVGALSAPNIHVGDFYLTPELALLAGNLFAFAIGPNARLDLTLQAIEQVAVGSYDFVFRTNRPLAFRAGQYLEWTLPVPHADDRGNRRYFTIASSPSDGEIRLGVKFYAEPSAFKRALARLRPGDSISASQLAGDFVLPRNPEAKLAFIAGGIGITPFRSMLGEMIASGDRRSVVVLYGNPSPAEAAYSEMLTEAERKLNVHVVHALEQGAADRPGARSGLIDADLIAGEIPDYAERTFYVSGPPGMIRAVKRELARLGVPARRIKTDFFPGLT